MLLILVEKQLGLLRKIVESLDDLLAFDRDTIVLIRLDVVYNYLLLCFAALFEPLDLLPLLLFGQLGNVVSVTVSEPQKRRLVPLLLFVIIVLIVALFKYFVAVGLVILDKLLFEALRPNLLLVEYLHDLRLVHEDVCEVQVFLHWNESTSIKSIW